MSGSPFGVIVRHDQMSFLLTTSQAANEAVRNTEILREYQLKRLRKTEALLAKLQAGAVEIQKREAAGKARRPARKVEAA